MSTFSDFMYKEFLKNFENKECTYDYFLSFILDMINYHMKVIQPGFESKINYYKELYEDKLIRDLANASFSGDNKKYIEFVMAQKEHFKTCDSLSEK